MKRGSVKLYFGCGDNRYSAVLPLTTGKMDEWYYYNLKIKDGDVRVLWDAQERRDSLKK